MQTTQEVELRSVSLQKCKCILRSLEYQLNSCLRNLERYSGNTENDPSLIIIKDMKK